MTLWKVTASGVRLADELSRPRTPCGVHPRDRDTGGTADSRERLDPRVHACHDNGAPSGYGLMNQPCQRFTGEPQSGPTPRLAAAVGPNATGQPETSPGRCSRFRRGSTFAAARQHNDGAGRSMHERAFPHAAAIRRYTGWAAGRVCDRGSTARWVARQAHHGEWDSRNRFGLGWGRFAAGHVIARSVRLLAGQADTASGRAAGQGECLSRKLWRERDDRAGFLRASAGRASICSVHMRVYRAQVTAVRLLDACGLRWVTRPGMRPWDATTGSRFSSRRAGRCDAPRTSGGTRSC